MNKNSMAIIMLCSHLCAGEDVRPLKPSEWNRLAEGLRTNKLQPCELLSFTRDDFKSKLGFNTDELQRVSRLLDRGGGITLEIRRYADMGINIMTRADKLYPKRLKSKLGKSCPPIFYYAGNPGISLRRLAGFVGARNAEVNDEKFTKDAVRKVNAAGAAIVSGGARGVDSIASKSSIGNGSFSMEYICDSLIKKIQPRETYEAIVNGRLLILSAAIPNAGFSTGIAMMRNNFIYAQSDATVVVKADYNKGGTWNGAAVNLKKQWCNMLCWNNPEYTGNMELIKRGAIPIDETWNGELSDYMAHNYEQPEQLNLLDT